MPFAATLANAAWHLASLPGARQFASAARDVKRAQRDLLLRVVNANRDTEFGRAHDFASIRDARDFAARVPLATHDDFAARIQRIARGEQNVLTKDRVTHLIPTSGTTTGAKLIPYTRELLADFNRAIAPWIVSLFSEDRALRGAAYWSVTPLLDAPRISPGGIPIGFTADDDYLPPLRRRLARAVQAVPQTVAHLADIDAFRDETLRHLVARGDLRLISIWNPTFLTLLLEHLGASSDRIADALERNGNRARAAVLRRAAHLDPAARHQMLWPHLRVVSCWADASAARESERLHALLPHARLQPKGLLSTEGVVSIPKGHADGAALAVRSHFFEFVDDTGVHLAHELRVGGAYEVVLTTSGGLYRYRTGDLVEVTALDGELPILRFIGRANTSDAFGEKLTEAHARSAIERACPDAQFAMLALEDEGEPHYALFVDAEAAVDVDALDESLRTNPHYEYCRRLGQLGPARVVRVEGDAHGRYLAACQSDGQRLGDIKPLALHPGRNWTKRF